MKAERGNDHSLSGAVNHVPLHHERAAIRPRLTALAMIRILPCSHYPVPTQEGAYVPDAQSAREVLRGDCRNGLVSSVCRARRLTGACRISSPSVATRISLRCGIQRPATSHRLYASGPDDRWVFMGCETRGPIYLSLGHVCRQQG